MTAAAIEDTDRQNTVFKRIAKEFPSKALIGDIMISDEEYEVLVFYLRVIFHQRRVKKAFEQRINSDIFFAVVLVQIGIRYYSQNYWSHVETALQRKIDGSTQKWIRESFSHVLRTYQKAAVDENSTINNILMHGFVSDKHAQDLFRFLFQYYRIDLLRNIENNSDEMFEALLDAIRKNDSTNRTTLIVQQTQQALIFYPEESAVRLKRLLELMDIGFHDNQYLAPENRIHRLLNDWMLQGSEFQKTIRTVEDRSRRSSEKRYFRPFFRFDFSEGSCKLSLPTQLVKEAVDEELIWNISIDGESVTSIPVGLFETGITGSSTEDVSLNLEQSQWFADFQMTLQDSTGENQYYHFSIPQEPARFFDKNGMSLKPENFPEGEVYAITPVGNEILSESFEKRSYLTYDFYTFDFSDGDIVYFSDGRSYIIGSQFIEGISRKGLIRSAHILSSGEVIAIHTELPLVRFQIEEKAFPGTVLIINHTRCSVNKANVEKIKIHDGSSEVGYQLQLGDFIPNGCGLYEVIVDVPNDHRQRHYRFACLPGYRSDFKDSPYFFQELCVVAFSPSMNVKMGLDAEPIPGQKNMFRFMLDSEHLELNFELRESQFTGMIAESIPCFQYQFDEQDWQIERPAPLTRKNFPYMIRMKLPVNELNLFLDDESKPFAVLQKNSKEMFIYDTTRLRNWFLSEKTSLTVSVGNPDSHEKERFFTIQIKSQVLEHRIEADYDTDRILGFFNIIGNAVYSADIAFQGEQIATSLPVVDGRFETTAELKNGKYQVNLFEEEEDETGFGIDQRIPIGSYELELINQADLTGRTIRLLQIEEEGKPMRPLNVKTSAPLVTHLYRKNAAKKNEYFGNLESLGIEVRLVFPNSKDLSHAKVDYYSDEKADSYSENDFDYCDFIYYVPEEKLYTEEHDTSIWRRYTRSLLINNKNTLFVISVE